MEEGQNNHLAVPLKVYLFIRSFIETYVPLQTGLRFLVLLPNSLEGRND